MLYTFTHTHTHSPFGDVLFAHYLHGISVFVELCVTFSNTMGQTHQHNNEAWESGNISTKRKMNGRKNLFLHKASGHFINGFWSFDCHDFYICSYIINGLMFMYYMYCVHTHTQEYGLGKFHLKKNDEIAVTFLLVTASKIMIMFTLNWASWHGEKSKSWWNFLNFNISARVRKSDYGDFSRFYQIICNYFSCVVTGKCHLKWTLSNLYSVCTIME